MSNDYKIKVAEILIDIESVKFSFEKPFILTSGLKSPVYVDCRKIISYTEQRSLILKFAIKLFEKNNLEFDLVAGGETAGIPYAAFISQILRKPMIYIRKKPKGFGKDQQIEGNYKKNDKVILIEDLATDGGSKVTFIDALHKSDLTISDIFVIFYYNIFDLKNTVLGTKNIKMHSLCTWKEIIQVIKEKKLYSLSEIKNLEFFLENPSKWRENL